MYKVIDSKNRTIMVGSYGDCKNFAREEYAMFGARYTVEKCADDDEC